MIFPAGDTHGSYDMGKLTNFPIGNSLTRLDYVLITGDFGVFFENPQTNIDKIILQWYNEQPWTTLFCRGNHDNPDMLEALPIVEMFGGKVGVAAENVFYLRDGEVYTIDGKTIFVFGGAMSTDKNRRVEGRDWWANEVASKEVQEYGLENLRKVDHKVDYIITHTAPRRVILEHIVPRKPVYLPRAEEPTAYYLDLIDDTTEFKHWYFGHFHMDLTFEDQFHLMYDKILTIE